MYAFLSWEWSGVVVSAALLALGLGLVAIALARIRTRVLLRRSLLGLGGLTALLALVLTVTSARHAVAVGRALAEYPAPGRMVDVGGYEMHVFVEGENAGNSTLVWIPGGHSAGFNFYNMHAAFRGETRSILFDRPATGWSDVGPFPRTTSLEVDELDRLMNAIGETDPFVLVGHSYGGLLAVSYAMRYPERVAGLVLLDSGITENWENPVTADFMMQLSRTTLVGAVMATFGVPVDAMAAAGANAELIAELMAHYERELGDVWPELTALNMHPMNGYGTASVFAEIGTPEFFVDNATRPGVLDGTPGTYITFLGGEDLTTDEALEKAMALSGMDAEGAAGQLEGLQRNRDLMESISDRMTSYSIPDGATHNFPYERPQFVIEHVRRVMELVKKGASAQPSSTGSPV